MVPRVAADSWHCDRDDYRYGYDGGGRYDRCAAGAESRIAKDRALIRRWEGTGRHQKVVEWAREDLARVDRDYANCRAQARNDRYYDRYDRDVVYDPRPTYDPYYGADPYYGRDRYDDAADRDFDWKRDWPLVLGTVLNAQLGR